MHHLAVKSNLVDMCPDTPKNKFGGNDQLVCPKPRRAGSGIPEHLKPLKCSSHRQINSDGRSANLNMITEKTADGREESVCIGCSPTCYSGSPPSRTDNPLVHDVQFVHQMELLSQPFTPTNLSGKFGFSTSASIE